MQIGDHTTTGGLHGAQLGQALSSVARGLCFHSFHTPIYVAPPGPLAIVSNNNAITIILLDRLRGLRDRGGGKRRSQTNPALISDSQRGGRGGSKASEIIFPFRFRRHVKDCDLTSSTSSLL